MGTPNAKAGQRAPGICPPGVGRLLAALAAAVLLGAGGAAPAAAQEPGLPPPEVIEARFLEALALVDAGRPEAAIPIFRAILAADPTLTRVRLELARAYYEAKLWVRARQEFFTVLSGDLPDAVRQNVLGFIEAIDARRGFEWDLALGVTSAGDTRAFDSDRIVLDFGFGAVPIDIARKGAGGPGLAFDLTARLRATVPAMSDAGRATTAFAEVFVLGVDGQGRFYDELTLGARAGLRVTRRLTTASLGLVGQTRFDGGRREEDERAVEAAFERRDARGRSVFAAVRAADRDNRVGSAADATVLRGQLGAGRSLGGRAAVSAIAFGEIVDATLDFEDSREIGLRVAGRFDLSRGWRIQPTAFVSKRDFPTPNPAFTADRDETSAGLGLRVEKTDWFVADGAFPFAEVAYRRTRSGIDAFSYRELVYTIGFSREF